MLARIRQGQHVLQTAERGKEATAVTFFKAVEKQRDSLELGEELTGKWKEERSWKF